ncbi:MAG TPA: MutS family DNA mismatch repair protein [Roseiflexaceae bacterium]|nr:MutS family DNA mismatch repair protein [Roseiflexaceae bacterium]
MAQPQRPTPPSDPPEMIYQRRCVDFGRQRDAFNRRSYRNANLSLLLIAGALVLLGLWLWRGAMPLLILAALLGLGFVISFVHHGRVDRQLRRYVELYAINAEGLLRLARDWGALPLRQPPEQGSSRKPREGFAQLWAPYLPLAGPAAAVPAEPAKQGRSVPAFAGDLDLLGHASLQHLLNTPATPIGQERLRDWLLAPAAHLVARQRQPAGAELSRLIDLRDEFALRGRLMGAAQSDYERFLGWAEGRPWLERRSWLLALARMLALATLGLGAAQLLGLTNYPFWLIGMAGGLALTATIGRSVDQAIDAAAERQTVFATYADLFELLGDQPFAAPVLQQLQRELTAGGVRADGQMRRLSRLMALADLRGWMFFYPIQLATLWNVHVLWLLERWQRTAGARARAWLDALGDFEALAALATLAHDNPTWVFPELYDPSTDSRAATAPMIEAVDLGHPLLPPAVRVGNDVSLGPPGSFLLVTGSNMSGKSTLLRAIGMNVVLAQAGGPVCAATLRVPPLALASSMRVQDSLEQGVSYFMAELQRLKEVINMSTQVVATAERTPLFLLDEILHGTNTTERQIAARRIILHLLSLGATGAISTHDLTLADAPEFAAVSRLVHFTEQFTRGEEGMSMTFDYRLRPGIATSTNALKLMEMLGLLAQDSEADKMTS